MRLLRGNIQESGRYFIPFAIIHWVFHIEVLQINKK